MWNEVKKVKNAEKKNQFDQIESQRKVDYMNNHSRELLRQKN